MTGITFDTGALIALEHRRQRMKAIVEHALAKDQPITVPADVVGEWWRGRTDLRDNILDSVDVEPLTEAVAKRAGEARAAIKGATLVDAIVMASAASRGDVVYSSDLEDLERLRRYFPGVRGPSNLKIVWAYKAHWYLENRVRIRTRFSRCKGTVRLRRPTCSVALTRALGEL